MTSTLKALAWLGRKVQWGLREGQLAQWVRDGPETVIDRLVHPDEHGVVERRDRFAGTEVEEYDDRPVRKAELGVELWVENAVTSRRPLETFMEFFWSGFFAVSMRTVLPQTTMFGHMNLLGDHGLGNFRELLEAVTIDAAMLDFLDGGRSTAVWPNENFPRELLELYSVGVGHFTEADVAAAARSLTGWKMYRRTGDVEYFEEKHDKSPQTLLGVSGVNDVRSTIGAVVQHPAAAPRIADKISTAILGPGYDKKPTASLVHSFAKTWEIRPLVHGLLELGMQGQRRESIVHPLAWYGVARQMPVRPADPDVLRQFFLQSGLEPMQPPNVGGYPGATTYLSTSATVARLNLAHHLSQRPLAPLSGMNVVELTADLDAFAARFGLVDGFIPPTAASLRQLPAGPDRLAAALSSPDLLVVS